MLEGLLFKIGHKAIVTKYGHKNKYVHKWKEIEDPNMRTYNLYHLILKERKNTYNREKIAYSTNDSGKTRYSHTEELNWTNMHRH